MSWNGDDRPHPAPAGLWLRETLGPDPSPLPPLEGAARADVAVVGGGYVGLWTAIRIKELDPACDVVVLEQDLCGSGASGRNGGFVLSWWPKLESLVGLVGEDEALRLCRASDHAIDEIETSGIDCAFRRGGFLWTSASAPQDDAWEAAVRACEARGLDVFERLSPADVARRTGSDRHRGGVLERRAATVQPAALVRGLLARALGLGVRVHERSRVRRLDRRSPPVVRTERGAVACSRVVLATNAWAASLRGLHTRLVVVSSDIVATAPIPERLAALGWTGGEAISDSALMVHYYRTTDDGRLVFGKGGWGIALAGRIPASFDRHARRAQDVTRDLHWIYPSLAGVPIDAAWSGPIDRPAHGLPLIGRLGGRDHLLYGVGWSGNGVGPSVVGARILASLALRRDDEWARSALVDGVPGRFPPEPVRYVGAHVVRGAVVRKERDERAGRPVPAVARRLAALAPGSFASGQSHGREAHGRSE